MLLFFLNLTLSLFRSFSISLRSFVLSLLFVFYATLRHSLLLSFAGFHGNKKIVQLYIEHNALLNTQSGYGWTALHYAGQANKIECASLLMAAGCNNMLTNSKGKTAQVRAASQGKDEMAALI
jgi:ankyrin repeat protein